MKQYVWHLDKPQKVPYTFLGTDKKLFAVYFVTIALFAAFALGKGEDAWGAGTVPLEGGPLQARQAQEDNLLVNGSMEEGFYWKYPNHFVANGWLRWWEDDEIPEYDDVRESRPWRYDGNHAQIYHRWGRSYTAGIYQQVDVEPCTFYRFSMYGRNHSDVGIDHHACVGINPLGRQYDLYMSELPTDTIWSPGQTFLYVWGLHTVTAESRSDHITAITYVSPDSGYYPYDTFWDAGTLVKVPPPSGRLADPQIWNPDGLITEVVSDTQPGRLVIEWETTEPASTQVWYSVSTPTPPITPTGTLFATIYMPLLTNWQPPGLYTPVDQAGETHHQAVIQSLEDGQVVEFVILARRLVDGTCRTSPSPFFRVPIHFSGTASVSPNSAGDAEVIH